MYAPDRPCISCKKGGGSHEKSAAAALILMVLLFGGAYLTATEPDAPAPETPQAQGDGEVVLTIKPGRRRSG